MMRVSHDIDFAAMLATRQLMQDCAYWLGVSRRHVADDFAQRDDTRL